MRGAWLDKAGGQGGSVKVAIGLGASLGARRTVLARTVSHLDAWARATGGQGVLRLSRWWRSPPLPGGAARGWFLNGVVLADVGVSPAGVLAWCRAREDAAGRRRAQHWGDRPLDLDVLVVEGFTSDDPQLVVPHPAIASRDFVWFPLGEAWPEALVSLRAAGRAPPTSAHAVPVGVSLAPASSGSRGLPGGGLATR